MSYHTNHREAVNMSCGHRMDKKIIIGAIQSTFITNKHQYEIKCPQAMCGKTWELDECSEAINMSDEQYEHYALEIEKRASPPTKKCPFCNADCEEPDTTKSYMVQCACSRRSVWCWLCQNRWQIRDYNNCGNAGCELNKSNKKMHQSINNKYNNNYANMNDDDNKDDDEKVEDYVMTDNQPKKEKTGQQSGNGNNKKSKKKKNGNKKKEEKAVARMRDGIIGLSNLGNTCFMNSALQCLLQCPRFVERFFYDKVKLPTKPGRFSSSLDKNSISYIWSSFVKEIYTSRYSSLAPHKIKNALNRLNPVIGNGTQEDAFCVIETLLQGLDEELFASNTDGIYHEQHVYKEKDIPSQQKIHSIVNGLWESHTKESRRDCAVIRELFDGIECEKLTCPDCNYQLRSYQNFRHIPLPLVNKNITLNIKVYIPEINECKSKPLNLTLAFDNTVHGLKYIVLAALGQDFLQKYNMNKENVDIKFGYVHPSNNDASNDVNGWIKYMENGNCAKIKNSSSFFAVINRRSGKYKFIPTFNLIVNEKDRYVDNVIDLLTFTKINAGAVMVPGNEMINHSSQIAQSQQLSDYDSPIIYYNNRLVTNKKSHKIKIIKNASLLRIWIHRHYTKDSPKNVSIDIDAKDQDVIQRALQKSSNKSVSTIEYLMDILQQYWTQLSTFDLTGVLAFCYNNENYNKDQQNIQNEKKNAKLVYEKLKQLSDSEKLANEWLKMKIGFVMKQHKKEGVNYTKPKMLDNVNECLQVYEMKETSDGNGVDCQRCPECPEIASREVDIIKTPQILTIHIDREQAEFNQRSSSKKRDNLIKYPISDLKFGNDVYDLFGVVEHYGYGTDWGHYVCYVKGLQDQAWHKMNDRTASTVYNERDVITKDASVLLYHKKSMKSMNK